MLLNVIIYFLCIFQLNALSIKIFTQDDLQQFSIVDASMEHTGTDAYIRLITDGKNKFILKQINDPSFDEQFLLINDLIASAVGYQEGIPINEVSLIPYNVGSHLKKYQDRAATIHSYVQGKDLEQALPQFLSESFSIHQRSCDLNCVWQKKYPLPEWRQGLNSDIIESMLLHDDLIKLVAFDLFVGNTDRSLPNLFYDQNSNSFYGIDHAAAFHKLLAQFACIRLEELMQRNYFFNNDAIRLEKIRFFQVTLAKLYENNSPSQIINWMNYLVMHLANDAQHDSSITERIAHHANIATLNYQYVAQFIELLNSITV